MAEEIAKKLEVKSLKPGTRHDFAEVFYDGKKIARFGIRRGSRKEAGHDHIPGELHCNTHFAKELAQCKKYLSDYIELMKQEDNI